MSTARRPSAQLAARLGRLGRPLDCRIDQGAYTIAWGCGLTAEIFDQVVDVDRWLLDAVDQIPDLEDAVNTTRAAIAAAAEDAD